jgi:predicted  nucleic acid-binding Zn-ribbon protein
MNADIQRLIELQRLDSTAHDARRRVSDEPARLRSFDERLEKASQEAAIARQHLSDNQTGRREVEKQVAVHQGRLSKFRDQLMSVKTNIEYQAMQKEIEFAQNEVKALEDKILERMLEADELTAEVKRSESELAVVQKTVDSDRRALESEVAELRQVIERIGIERTSVIRGLDPKDTVRRNEEIVQCDSCQRILYFAPAVTPDVAPTAP